MAETSNIRGSLLSHLRATDGAVRLRNPTGFLFETGEVGSMGSRRQALVAQLKPSCVVMESSQQTGPAVGGRQFDR